MTLSRAWLWCALALGAAGCGGGETTDPAGNTKPSTEATAANNDVVAPADDSPVIATVGGISITADEYRAAAQRKSPANGTALSEAERLEIVDKLIVEKMLYKEAKKVGIDRDPKVQKVMINTLLRKEVYASVRNSDFSQEELRAYFDAHKDEFVVPEKVQVKRIFIKTNSRRAADEAKALAEDLRAKVKAAPASFKDLAAEHSEDPYRRRGGDLGFLSSEGKPGIPPEVVEKAFTMNVGDVSEVFEGGGGYNVLLIANKRERVERTFEQMKGSVLRKVKNERYKELYDGYVEGIRTDYTVEVNKEVLGNVEVRPARRGPERPSRPGADGDDDEHTDDESTEDED